MVWAWGDLMNALQVFPNLIGVLGLSGIVAQSRDERLSALKSRSQLQESQPPARSAFAS